jgi:tetratricopeptide (TPR) repeat protein
MSPATLDARSDLGELLLATGDPAEAERQGRILLERSVAADNPVSKVAAINLTATALGRLGRVDEAAAMYEQLIADLRADPSASFVSLIATFHNAALLRFGQGRVAEARALLAEAVTLARANLRSNHPALASVLTFAGGLARLDGDLPVSEDLLRAAVTSAETLPADNFARLNAGVELAITLLARRKPAEAIAPLERAVEAFTGGPLASNLAEARFALARALVAAGRDRDGRARALAADARAFYAGAGATAEVAAIDAWLRR